MGALTTILVIRLPLLRTLRTVMLIFGFNHFMVTTLSFSRSNLQVLLVKLNEDVSNVTLFVLPHDLIG